MILGSVREMQSAYPQQAAPTEPLNPSNNNNNKNGRSSIVEKCTRVGILRYHKGYYRRLHLLTDVDTGS